MQSDKFFKTTDIKNDYQFLGELGEGSFAKVYEAVRKSDGVKVAVKVFDKKILEHDDQEQIHNEVEILRHFDHPNIVKLYEVYDFKSNFYMVLELMTGGELFDRIVEKENYTETEAQEVIKPIVDSIAYCHQMGVSHRDLKPENILYSSPDSDAIIKISDFGLAKVVSHEDYMKTACGTPSYMAPEILHGKGYSNAVDFWSIGVVLYVLLCGYPPFYEENNAELFKKIQQGDIEFPSPEWDPVSSQVKDLIINLLKVDPDSRYNAQKILDHPWMNGEGISNTQLNSVTDKIKSIQKGKRFCPEHFDQQKFEEHVVILMFITGGIQKQIIDLKIPEDAKELISNLISLDSKSRYTPEQILDHKWMKKLFCPKELKAKLSDKLYVLKEGNIESLED